VVAVSVLGITVDASAVVPTADSPGVVAAKRQLAAWVQPMVTIPNSILAAPLPKTPPTGKKVFYIDTAIPNSTRVWNGFSAAAAVLGWAPTRLTYALQSEAVGQVQQAIGQGANYIVVAGVTQQVLQPGLDAARAANVPVFFRGTLDVPQGTANWIFANTAGGELYANQGKAAADWVVVSRNGKANTLVMTASGFPALKVFSDVFAQEYGKNCPGCGINVLDNPLASLGNGGMVTNAVAYIRAHPEVTNVVFCLGSAAFSWPAAAANAGLTNVVMSTSSASDGNLKLIAAGQQGMTVQWGLEQAGWVEIDAMARQSLNMSLTPNWKAAMPLLVNTVANTTVDTQSFAGGPKYTGLFKRVWHRG
jgi:ribose transport system substrate-binding protein